MLSSTEARRHDSALVPHEDTYDAFFKEFVGDDGAALSPSNARETQETTTSFGDEVCQRNRPASAATTRGAAAIAACDDTSAVTDGAKRADPSSTRCSLSLSYSCVRKITNTTYLRRIHLSKEDAIGLFPEIQENMEYTFSRRHRDTSAPFKLSTSFSIQDREGRRWPISLECVRTAGQRHTRISKGWSALCSANRFSVGRCLRFARWEHKSSSSPKDALITVSLVK